VKWSLFSYAQQGYHGAESLEIIGIGTLITLFAMPWYIPFKGRTVQGRKVQECSDVTPCSNKILIVACPNIYLVPKLNNGNKN
jgi:hypothetical protein